MRFYVDAWDPSYGTSVDTELDRTEVEVDTTVEMPPDQWAPIPAPPLAESHEIVLFVDGVRRIDAQLWIDESGSSASPALCASYAAGVIRCCAQEGASLVQSIRRRSMFATDPSAESVDTSAGTYHVSPVSPSARVAPLTLLSLALQNQLAATEFEVAELARAADPDTLVVVDGPLGRRQHMPLMIGFAKTHRTTYLPQELGGLVARLKPGERTPMFGVGDLHTWYLRLPCPPGAPWAGVVRVEAPARGGSSDLAARSQRVLPRYASTEYKDSRAPQNLYPIAGLERELRRRLGDPGLLYRGLRRASARQTVTAG